jgi:flotillin
MDIRDSKGSVVISNIMAKEKSRIEMESRVEVAQNHREAELKEIDAKRTVEVQKQDAEQQIGLRTAEKDKTVGMADEQAKQEIQSQAKVTAERNMAVREVEHVRAAEIAKQVAIVAVEQDRQVTVVNAEASKAAVVTKAEGDLSAAKFNAQGIEAQGIAKGVAEKAILMAPVETQITLAKEIGDNEGYQNYLITVRRVEASQAVGMETARSLGKADMKIIANAGDVMGGVGKLGDVLSTGGGTNFAGMLAALSQTDEGKALVEGLVSRITK